MEEFSTSIGLPTLSSAAPITTINFGLPASILQLYHTNTPVNTNELTIYHADGYTPKPWQTINPTPLNIPHALPDPPKDLLELQKEQAAAASSSHQHVQTISQNMSMLAFNGSVTSPMDMDIDMEEQPLPPFNGSVTSAMDMDIDMEEQPLPRPIPTRPFNNNYCRSPSSEQSDHSDNSNHQRKCSQSSSAASPPTTNTKKQRGANSGANDDRAERRKKGNTESQARSRKHNKIIKDLYENNDRLIETINQIYLKNGNHNDPLINKLLTEYQRLPKKQRPYKKRATSSPINEIV
uniref:BZIP domain-containing protein n=1 Tax=Panagrolaimus sp. ES5 TaxID=591445 RepID=A0AC34GCJ4_9BILA